LHAIISSIKAWFPPSLVGFPRHHHGNFIVIEEGK
jgi:hypothetical protein